MNRSIPLVFVLFFLTASFIILIQPVKASENPWVTKTPLPTARVGLGVAVVNGKIYAIGGQVASLGANSTSAQPLNTNEMYDPDTNTWTAKAPMPTARSFFGITVYQNRIYCIGGNVGPGFAFGETVLTAANEVYDPQTNTWENKSSMPTPRQDMQANTVGDKIYVIGGAIHYNFFNFQAFNVTEVYNPQNDLWTTQASLPNPAWTYASAVANNKIYIIGSGFNTTDGSFPNLNQVYDTETNTWSLGQPAPTGTFYAAANTINGSDAQQKIYVLGGYSNNGGIIAPNVFNLTQVFDVSKDAWKTGVQMPTSRWGLGVAVANGSLYAIGGSTGNGLGGLGTNVNEQFTPSMPSNTSSPSPIQSLSPLPSIPEFPSWIILPVALTATLLAIVTARNKRKKGE